MNQLDEAVAFGPEEIVDGHRHVGEEQFRGVLGMEAELLQVASALESLHPAFEDEERDPAMLLGRVGLHRGDDEVGVDAVGDERLRTVDDIVVAVSDRGGGHGREVGPNRRLGHGHGSDELTARNPRQPPRALLSGAVREEVREADVVVQTHAEARTTHARGLDLFVDHQVVSEVVDSPAAVLLGDRHAQEAMTAGGGKQVVGDDAGRFPFELVRHHFLVQPGPKARAQRLVLVLKNRALHVASSRSPTR